MRQRAFVTALMLASATGLISPVHAATPACVSSGIGTDSFCKANGAKLHFIDWGGTGPAIILLTGLGNSARIYDDLAPRLTTGHHVYAFTRRGYGFSEQTPGNYSNATLVGDVLAMLDALSIAKASFVGHSIAGGELSTLGAEHGGRVDRLIYLDSAYDRTAALDLMKSVPVSLEPTPQALASLDAFSQWQQAVLGVHSAAVDHDVRAIMTVTPTGVVPKTPGSVMLEVLKGDIAARPRYAEITAPALAIYGSKDMPEQLPPEATPQDRAAYLEYVIRRIRPWMLRAQADFIENIRCGVAIEVPNATHYLFLDRPDWVAASILSFLKTSDPCRWRTALPDARQASVP